jgi:hypothetical protein
MRRTAIYTLLITLVVSSCGPIEPTESEPVTRVRTQVMYLRKAKAE